MDEKIKRVYVASPLAGDIEGNIIKARGYCREVILHGDMPIASHIMYPAILDDNDPDQRALGLSFGLELLRLRDEVQVYGNYMSSQGVFGEIREAAKLGIPVIYCDNR